MKTALVLLEHDLSLDDIHHLRKLSKCSVVIGPKTLREKCSVYGIEWRSLEDLTSPGSIYEAAAFLEELSLLKYDNTTVAKSVMYQGYELWWMHYTDLYLNFCLPYTQYKSLLEYLKDMEIVYFIDPPYRDLFTFFLSAHNRKVILFQNVQKRIGRLLPIGVIVQLFLTLVCIPLLILKRAKILIFTGDKFAPSKDYDPRMEYIYTELRERKLSYVEFVRSLESWKTVISHACIRLRPVIYPVAVRALGTCMSVCTGALSRRHRALHAFIQSIPQNGDDRFKLLVSTFYLRDVDSDIWAIRFYTYILKGIGIRAAFFTAPMARNFVVVLASKLNNIPTVGILHGAASRAYNGYDFLPTYTGNKTLSLDRYGVWSEWWKEYYTENNKLYTEEQLVVSGPMRPLSKDIEIKAHGTNLGGVKKVLFVSEQLAVPEEVLPFLSKLLETHGIEVYMTFRPYRDEFEMWLKANHPQVLSRIGESHIIRTGIKDAIAQSDVVVGTHSTAVLEALFELKPIVFFATKKWGDYFTLKSFHPQYNFYAEDFQALIECIRKSDQIPEIVLRGLLERFFGDPYQNGSKWAVDQLELFSK